MPTDQRVHLADLLLVLLANFLNHRRCRLLWIDFTASTDSDRAVTHRAKRVRAQALLLLQQHALSHKRLQIKLLLGGAGRPVCKKHALWDDCRVLRDLLHI